MKLTIDNLDGNGAIDYSPAVAAGEAFTIERRLNEPSICSFALVPSASGTIVPARSGRVIVSDDSGIVLFTGYIATEPAMELAGQSTTGAIYRAVVAAISDEVLLDKLSVPQTGASYSETASQMMQTLLTRAGIAGITPSLALATETVGTFQPDAGTSWSKNAGALASMARSAYKASNGTLTMAPVGTAVHTLSESTGSLSLNALEAGMVKALANDITVCGENEAAAYVTEFFVGDGTTVLFDLTKEPFVLPASKETPLTDLFQEAAINKQLWQVNDAGGHISITSAGLTCTGGDGTDGDTYLAALSPLEIGGSLVMEANGVLFGGVTDGVLHGLYLGGIAAANCIAGFGIGQSAGSTTITPLINGVVSGSTFTPVAGQLYTLRLRIMCNEMQRVQQSYYYLSSSGVQSFGGSSVAGSANVILEVQDMTGGVAAAPVILYSGTLTSAPAICEYALIDSSDLACSIASVTVEQQGPMWVTGTPSGGSAAVLRLGTAAQGASCRIERTGKLRFYPSSIPAAGELIAVSYRTSRRAVARLASAASIAAETKGSMPGTAYWVGSVTSPAPRNSVDCENAASALLALATSRTAAWAGNYTSTNLELEGDVWPGDVLAVTSASAGITASLVVRSVAMQLAFGSPGTTVYKISFANDWADALAIRTSSTVPASAWLPQSPQTAEPLANLNGYSVTSVTGSAIQISAGVTPPTGGGFEVRRRDWAFGPGTDSDLVMRSTAASFTIPRETAIEQYYIRMYDAATPPNYSRLSSTIIVNVPLS